MSPGRFQRDTKIITLYMNKGDRRDCNNYRGISLLRIAGKVFARLLLPRVRQIADRILPESQCGFRPSRSLGSVVNSSNNLDDEINQRIGKASTNFGRLSSRVWKNHHLAIKLKIKVYTACILSVLLYSSET